MMVELVMAGNQWYLLLSCAVMFGLHIKAIRELEETSRADNSFVMLHVIWIGGWMLSMFTSRPFWSF